MFTFDNTHIFTGYLKQLLSSVPLPTCKVYTKEFSQYKAKTGREDPRILETTKPLSASRPASNINYIKDNSVYQYKWSYTGKPGESTTGFSWSNVTSKIFEDDKCIPNFTKVLKNTSRVYDTETHEYLGEYLRFLRDYHNVDLMSLYNCFSNTIYNNISCTIPAVVKDVQDPAYPDDATKTIKQVVQPAFTIDSYDTRYKIYAFPVKLFANYTIAIDSPHGYELCCGFYKTTLDCTNRGRDLMRKTYVSVRQSFFKQPIVYDKLDVKNWRREPEISTASGTIMPLLDNNVISRLDIAQREQDLKLFIKLPISCSSSITVLEGDYRNFNDCSYQPVLVNTDSKQLLTWKYSQNAYIVNTKPVKRVDINNTPFKPISKVQLLEFNTGLSYPFADRLVEYLVGSAVTPLDEIHDNIRRAQHVMNENGTFFTLDGIWEPKMQKLIYDQLICAGPIEMYNVPNLPVVTTPLEDGITSVNYDGSLTTKLVDRRLGKHTKVGLTHKSMLYDILGYVDRDAEKYYASWKKKYNEKKQKPDAFVRNTIQDVDIYNGLFDIT